MKKIIFAAVILALAGLLSPEGSSQPQNPNLAKVMKEKLRNSQIMLEGMALQDFAKIKRSADELLQLSKTAEWMAFKTPRYEMQNNEFRRAVETIYQKAKESNMDGVALAYQDMTMACIRCHRYVRELREARGPFVPGAPLASGQ
jgi:cytochrome c556